MTAITAAGLPYPTPTDDVYQTDRYIRDLQDAIDTQLRVPVQTYVGGLTTDASGQGTITIPNLTTVFGCCVFCVQNSPGAIPIRGQVLFFGGAGVITQWTMMNNCNGVPNTGGYTPVAYVGGLTVAAIAWGQ